jgi:hypothetical protein
MSDCRRSIFALVTFRIYSAPDEQKKIHDNNCMLVSGDPIDIRYVALKDSERFPLAGEGLVAKVDIPEATIFSHMSGHILTQSQHEDLKIRVRNYMKNNNLQPGLTTLKFYQTIQIGNLF